VVSKKKKAKVGARLAAAVARRRTLRRASVRAGAPTAKVGWRVGKVAAKRKVGGHAQRVGAAGKTAGSMALIYGPMAAEVLGLVDAPKPRRRAPVFAAGVVTGAGATYFLTRQRRD
jgi:hypothetical protein